MILMERQSHMAFFSTFGERINVDMSLLLEAEKYVTALFENDIGPEYEYHDFQHTLEVVHYCKVIGESEGITAKEREVLLLAAWFHDTGFAVSTSHHEKHSAQLARHFLEGRIPEEEIQRVESCILATQVPQKPDSHLAAILCDADMFHLSQQEEFMIRSEKLRKEWNHIYEEQIDEYRFWIQSLYFMSVHNYFTDYAKATLLSGKEFNKQQAREKIKALEQARQQKEIDLNKEIKKLKKKNDKSQMPARGIETMFRLTARNQINLSSIADNKANILISVNSIIISIIVTMLVRKFSEYPNIIVPSLIFLLTSLITMIFAILSTRPNIKKGRFNKQDVKEKKVNLLFFGNFYNMSLKDYDDAVKDMMKDYNGLYSNMIMDQYFLGKVLGKKYRLLRKAYTIFMFGFTISVLSFAIFALMVPVP